MQYEELDRLLDSLAGAVASENPQKGYWRDLWALVSQIRGGFKEARYPTLEEKHLASRRLNDLVEAAQQRSEEEKQRRAERQREWEQRVARSDRARQNVETKVAGTRPT